MPTRSKRSRRKIRLVREPSPIVPDSSPAAGSRATTLLKTAETTEKSQLFEAANQRERVVREIKMIGLVTGIVILALILLYIFFR